MYVCMYVYIYTYIYIYIYIHLSVLIPNKIEQYFQNILSEVTVRFPTKKQASNFSMTLAYWELQWGGAPFIPARLKTAVRPGARRTWQRSLVCFSSSPPGCLLPRHTSPGRVEEVIYNDNITACIKTKIVIQ